MDINEIKEALKVYFEANAKCSGAMMKEVFHESAYISGYRPDGIFKVRDINVFAGDIDKNAPKTPDPSFVPMDEILSIDFTGDNTAVARVKVRVANILFTDVLSYARVDGKWLIISKLYSGVLLDNN